MIAPAATVIPKKERIKIRVMLESFAGVTGVGSEGVDSVGCVAGGSVTGGSVAGGSVTGGSVAGGSVTGGSVGSVGGTVGSVGSVGVDPNIGMSCSSTIPQDVQVRLRKPMECVVGAARSTHGP